MEHLFEAGFSANGNTSGLGPGCMQAAHEATRWRDTSYKPREIWKYFPIGVPNLMQGMLHPR